MMILLTRFVPASIGNNAFDFDHHVLIYEAYEVLGDDHLGISEEAMTALKLR